jgi:hypothetical protein
MEGKSKSWARRVLKEANPCRWCYEWGHWVKDCLLKKQKKPPVVDPRLQNPNFCLKKSSVCHPGLARRGNPTATVALVEKQPGGEDQALLDSGATDSVSNNVCFFTTMRPISMNLIVASTEQFPMKAIGDIQIPTPYGNLRVSNVLYCPNIRGKIVSIGKFKRLDGEVRWNVETYTLVQDDVLFPSQEHNDWCFIPFERATSVVSSLKLENFIAHQRIGHLSLRMLKGTISKGAVLDAPEVTDTSPNRCC